MEFDLVITNGVIVTTSTLIYPPESDIAIRDGKICCIGQGLTAGQDCRIIDAEGGYVTPGGVDGHCHLDQGPGRLTGDRFYSGTRSAIAGGTTTILCFALQEKTDASLFPVVQDYHSRVR